MSEVVGSLLERRVWKPLNRVALIVRDNWGSSYGNENGNNPYCSIGCCNSGFCD